VQQRRAHPLNLWEMSGLQHSQLCKGFVPLGAATETFLGPPKSTGCNLSEYNPLRSSWRHLPAEVSMTRKSASPAFSAWNHGFHLRVGTRWTFGTQGAQHQRMTCAVTGPLKLPVRTTGNEMDVGLMRIALELAREAYRSGEVPIGALIVDDAGRVLGRGRNRVEESCDATAHAEMEAIRASRIPGARWRLPGTTLYTTVEPCAMCCAAASLARVRRIVYAAPDLRLGACGTWIDLPAIRHPFHALEEISNGVCCDEAAQLLRDFFRQRRPGNSTSNVLEL
jgi:tRNA(adenine34) deaminase